MWVWVWVFMWVWVCVKLGDREGVDVCCCGGM
jgi:hypothetical protein